MRPGKSSILASAIFVLSILPPGPATADPTEFRAVYKADYKGLPISATGVRELTHVEGNRYLLSSSARNFLAKVTEQSLFTWEEDGKLTPAEYQYHRSGLGRNRDAVLTFDWDENRVLNDVQSKPWLMDVPDGAMDKLLYQLKIRIDLNEAYRQNKPWPELSYEIADGGRLKVYRFEVVGRDRTETPLGTFDTIKARRIRDAGDDRTTIFWMAPAYEFMLIRFRQFEEEGGGFELLLKAMEFGGKPVSARSPEPGPVRASTRERLEARGS